MAQDEAHLELIRARADALADARAAVQPRPHLRGDLACHVGLGPGLRRRRPAAGRGDRRGAPAPRSRTPGSTRERSQIATTLQESLLPARAARDPRARSRRALPPHRRGGRGRRRLLRPVPGGRRALGGRRRRRLRQGARRRRRDRARPLHAARRGDARGSPSRAWRCSTRRCCASARPALLHGRPTPTSSRGRRRRRVTLASGGHPLPLVAPRATAASSGWRARHAAGRGAPTPTSWTAETDARARATRSSSTPTA